MEKSEMRKVLFSVVRMLVSVNCVEKQQQEIEEQVAVVWPLESLWKILVLPLSRKWHS